MQYYPALCLVLMGIVHEPPTTLPVVTFQYPECCQHSWLEHQHHEGCHISSMCGYHHTGSEVKQKKAAAFYFIFICSGFNPSLQLNSQPSSLNLFSTLSSRFGHSSSRGSLLNNRQGCLSSILKQFLCSSDNQQS